MENRPEIPTKLRERPQVITVSDTKEQILAIARANQWDNVMVMGTGEMSNSPKAVGGWMVYPADKYPGEIPVEGMNRVYALMNAGVRIKGVAVMDDLRQPKLINPPDPVKRKPLIQLPKVMWGFVFLTTAKILGGIVAAIAAVVVGAVLLALAVVLGTALLVVAGVGAAIAYDPTLVVITEEDEWVSVFSWYDS